MLLITCHRVLRKRLLNNNAPTGRFLSLKANMSANKPAIPRASSSAIIIDHNNRVLMVERSLSSKSFAGAYVRYMHIFYPLPYMT